MAVPKITERSPWGTYPNADPKKAPKPAGTATMEAAEKMKRRSIPPKTRGIDDIAEAFIQFLTSISNQKLKVN